MRYTTSEERSCESWDLEIAIEQAIRSSPDYATAVVSLEGHLESLYKKYKQKIKSDLSDAEWTVEYQADPDRPADEPSSLLIKSTGRTAASKAHEIWKCGIP